MKLALLLSLALLAPAFAYVRSGNAPARQDGNPRQFDFWVGSWECHTQAGQLAGTNTIEKILNGRVLQENWENTGGSPGKSFNIYDAVTGMWHQTWVDSSGTLLLLDGGLMDDGSMVMEGTRPAADGGEVLHRITWTPLEGGQVNQVWDTSSDGGDTWTNSVDLIYSPVPGKAPVPAGK